MIPQHEKINSNITTLNSNITTLDSNKQAKPTVLYDNSSGTTGTVTLSKSASNFNYLEIFYKDTSEQSRNAHESVRVYSPNGKYVSVGILAPVKESSNELRWARKTMLISGTSITNKDYLAGYISSSTFSYWGVSEISIIRVDGYI